MHQAVRIARVDCDFEVFFLKFDESLHDRHGVLEELKLSSCMPAAMRSESCGPAANTIGELRRYAFGLMSGARQFRSRASMAMASVYERLLD